MDFLNLNIGVACGYLIKIMESFLEENVRKHVGQMFCVSINVLLNMNVFSDIMRVSNVPSKP